jgi:hypothetical protein
MRKTIVILVIAVAAAAAFASCTTERSGCKYNQGFVGYGSAR